MNLKPCPRYRAHYLPLSLGYLLLAASPQTTAEESSAWTYGSRGWEWSNESTGSYLWAGLRMQSRFNTRENDPLEVDDLLEDSDAGQNNEISAAVNWFFRGHRNKLTVDVSYLDISEDDLDENDLRFRVQWDLSL
ncbi:MAG: hypothetical protein AAGI11_13690 [Pseudomonadota bacterium]